MFSWRRVLLINNCNYMMDVLKAPRRLHLPWYDLGSYFRSCLILPGDRPTPIALGPTSRTTITGLAIPDEVGGGAGSTGCPWWAVDLGLGIPVSGFTLKDSWAGFVLLPDACSLVCGGSLAAAGCKMKLQPLFTCNSPLFQGMCAA